jgi:hypothetical protein
MKKFFFAFSLIITMLFAGSSFAQISGSVYRDFDLSKTRTTTSPIEPLISGVIVNVYNASNTIVASYRTTVGSGVYPFTGPNFTIPTSGTAYSGVQGSNTGFVANGTPVRLEFIPATGDYATTGTTVQFVTGASSTVDLGLNTAAEKSDANPRYVFPIAGSMLAASTPATTMSMASGLYDANDVDVERVDANLGQTGSIWGLAYQKLTKKMFVSAMLKRPIPLGPQGLGGLYMFDYSNATAAPPAPTGYNLEGVVSTNTPSTTINFGSVNRSATATNDNYVSGNLSTASRDNDAFAKIGKVGYGDIEFDETQKNLWAINLNQRTLIKIDVSTGTPDLTTVQSFPIIGGTGMPTYAATRGELRPWALKFYKGRGYIGLVGDASVSQNVAADLIAYVVSFDPTNLTAGYTQEFNFSLGYAREKVECAGLSGVDDGCLAFNGNNLLTIDRTDARWKPWADSWAQLGFVDPASGRKSHQQPILSGIDFMDDGSMVLGFSNRYAAQMSAGQYTSVAGSTNTSVGGQNNGGDIIKATKVTLGWVTEQGENDAAPDNTRNTDGIGGGGEFFWGDYFYNPGTPNSTLHGENANGAVAVLPGSGEVLSTAFDPKNTTLAATNGVFGMGTERFSITTGVKVDGWIIEQTSLAAPNNGIGFTKGNAMGDVEFITDMPAIEVGNRIWFDTNGNGIQDAGETTAGVPTGTTVNLYTSTGVLVATTTTDANGNYFFSSLNIAADPRKPASWTGLGNTLLPGYDYRIEVAIPGTNVVTQTDISGNTMDGIDNDATAISGNAVVTFNTNNVNHNYDIGITTLTALSVKDLTFTATLGNKEVVLNFTLSQIATGNVFTIERSTNGVSFTAIGTVAGTNATSYNYTDIAPNLNGKNYYRIKEVEVNGQVSYSDIRLVKFGKDVKVEVYPVPAISNLNITITEELINKPVVISLYNATGQEVVRTSVSKASGTETIDVSQLSSGVYQLRVSNTKQVVAERKIMIAH